MTEFTEEDLDRLREAILLLESPAFLVKAANMIGAPVERLLASLPTSVSTTVRHATTAAIQKALVVAVGSLGTGGENRPARMFHKIAVGTTGGIGGFFGLASLAVELPISTTLMLRSIAEIARSEGEDLQDPNTQMACLEVFALGGRAAGDDAAETTYYAMRATLARAVSEAASFIAERGLAREGAPPLVRLVTQIAARFGIVVSDKAAAQLVPLVGAAGGASINLLFMDHFQKMASGHFTIRSLEREYGPDAVEAEYERLRDELAA